MWRSYAFPVPSSSCTLAQPRCHRSRGRTNTDRLPDQQRMAQAPKHPSDGVDRVLGQYGSGQRTGRTRCLESGSTSRCVRWSRICIWMKSWSNSTRAGHAAIPDSRRPDIRIGRARHALLSKQMCCPPGASAPICHVPSAVDEASRAACGLQWAYTPERLKKRCSISDDRNVGTADALRPYGQEKSQ